MASQMVKLLRSGQKVAKGQNGRAERGLHFWHILPLATSVNSVSRCLLFLKQGQNGPFKDKNEQFLKVVTPGNFFGNFFGRETRIFWKILVY